jgi:hypothetical protein
MWLLEKLGGNPDEIVDRLIDSALCIKIGEFEEGPCPGWWEDPRYPQLKQWNKNPEDYYAARENLADRIIGLSSTPKEEDPVPQFYLLKQNYPNPFNSETTIAYQLPSSSAVRLEVFNLRGERVVTLVDEPQGAGSYSVNWDARDAFGKEVASGVYLYRLTAENFVKTRRLILLK